MTRLRDVVIPAGGIIDAQFRAAAQTPFRALAPIGPDRRPVLQIVVDALRSSGCIGRIIVAAPSEVRQAVVDVDHWLPCDAEGPVNILRGLALISDRDSALVCTSDLPLVTSNCIEEFVSQISELSDLTIGIVEADTFNLAFSDAPPSQFVPLKDAGNVTIGCLFQVRPKILQENEALLKQIFAARKSQWRMIRLLGLKLTWQFAVKSLSLASLTDFAEKRFSCRAAVIHGVSPLLAYDIDNVDDYTYARNR